MDMKNVAMCTRKVHFIVHLVHLRNEPGILLLIVLKSLKMKLAPDFIPYSEGIEAPGARSVQWLVHLTLNLATPTATCFQSRVKQQEGLKGAVGRWLF